MLDQKHGDAEPIADGADQRAEVRDLFVIEPAGGLVEQQQQRACRPARAPVRRACARPSAGSRPAVWPLPSSPTKANIARAVSSNSRSSLRAGRQRERVGQRPVAAARVRADFDVVEHRHGGEQGRGLEGAADAERGDVRRRAAAQRLSVQPDVALRRPIEPAQAIEQGGFAGAVRPDQSDDTALGDGERDVIERDDAAEAHRHAGDVQQRRDRAVARRSLRGISVMPLDAPCDFILRDPPSLIFAPRRAYPTIRLPAKPAIGDGVTRVDENVT